MTDQNLLSKVQCGNCGKAVEQMSDELLIGDLPPCSKCGAEEWEIEL